MNFFNKSEPKIKPEKELKKIYGIASGSTQKQVKSHMEYIVKNKKNYSIVGLIIPSHLNVPISSIKEVVKEDDVIVIGSFFDIDDKAESITSLIAPLLEAKVRIINLEEKMELNYKNLFLLGSRFELMKVSKRLTEGRRMAQERGEHIGRSKTPQKVIEDAIKAYKHTKMHVNEICEQYAISRSTLYREIKRRRITKRHSL